MAAAKSRALRGRTRNFLEVAPPRGPPGHTATESTMHRQGRFISFPATRISVGTNRLIVSHLVSITHDALHPYVCSSKRLLQKKDIQYIFIFIFIYIIYRCFFMLFFLFLFFLDVLEMGKISVKKHTHSRVETDPCLGGEGFNEKLVSQRLQSDRWLSYR